MRKPQRPARRRLALLASLLLALVASPVGTLAQSPAPVLADPAAEGGALATEFLTILGLPDADKPAALDAFLAPEFQIVRANGDHLLKADYLAAPATVHEFQISDVAVTQTEDVVVVSYILAITETIDGLEQTTTAPRLSVFHWSGTAWQLAAHSNFGALSITPGTSPEPSASAPA